MQKENGNISIHTENILPIIKKWLYSDRDIFIRELISNGCDAISKLKSLSSMGEASYSSDTTFEVKVILDKEKKTLQFIDNGIGMTDEEVKKYINQVAFSGAEDFMQKYKEKMDEQSQIIGHFGLGFYSAFMVSEKVQIDTLSYKEGSQAVRWICDGGTEYEMDLSDRDSRGTTITLFLNEDSAEFLEEFKVKEIINKYCAFMPIPIYLVDANKKEEKKEVKEGETVDVTPEEPTPLNDIHPLWIKDPKECTDEEYKEFYRKVFFDFNEPLFWIHLNVDYPFNLKGILYFPKLKHEFESIEGQIKLFNNQVFVADNIKEVIPEFLMLLKGVIDCKDLPLNVSRSFLQTDSNVIKISKHITKKVADKLTGLFKNERENFNNFWEDINPFIKFGCIRENDFYDKVKDILIYKTTNGEYITLQDYLEKYKEKHEKKVFYVTDEAQQSQYIKLFKEHDMEAIILTSTIDKHFIQFLETKESGVTFNRIDSDLSDTMKEKESEDEAVKEADKKTAEALEGLFKTALNNDALKIKVEGLNAAELPAIVLISEQSRRMSEMRQMFVGMNMPDMFKTEETLVLNKNNDLVQAILKLKDNASKKDDVTMVCEHIYDLAMLSNKPLDSEAMSKFIKRSNTILSRLASV